MMKLITIKQLVAICAAVLIRKRIAKLEIIATGPVATEGQLTTLVTSNIFQFDTYPSYFVI